MTVMGERAATRLTLVLVAMTLVLSGLTLGNVAHAQAPSDLTCEVGQLEGTQCVEEADRLVLPPFCATSDTVFEDGDDCFTRLEKTGTCPSGTTLDPSGDFCLRPVVPVESTVVDGPTCPEGFTDTGTTSLNPCQLILPSVPADPACGSQPGVAGDCYLFEAPIQTECLEGVLIAEFGPCAVEIPPGPASSCPVGFSYVAAEDLCVKLASTVGEPICPDGYTYLGVRGCQLPIDDASAELYCQDARATLVGSDCVIVIDCSIESVCQSGPQCDYASVIVGCQPDPQCNYASVIVGCEQLRCLQEFDLILGNCYLIDPTYGCEFPVAVDVFGCYQWSAPIVACTSSTVSCEPPCPAGFAPDEFGLCVSSSPALSIDPVCAVAFLGAPRTQGTTGDCFLYSEGSLGYCPAAGATDFTGGCRVPIPDFQFEPYCELMGTFLLPGGEFCEAVAPYAINCSLEQALLSDCGSVPDAGCPVGFSIDDSLGLCARFEPASQADPTCPDGARGVAGGCYILVARGPAGPPVCQVGVLAGGTCVVTGPGPINSDPVCPVGPTVFEDASGCYSLASPICLQGSLILGECLTLADPTVGHTCMVSDGFFEDEFGSCFEPAGAPLCAPGSTLVGIDCRTIVPPVPGPLRCADETTYGLIDGMCITYVTPAPATPQCPTGSIEDSDGGCRKPVADAAGAYFCVDPQAALNGRSCVFTAGFVASCDPASGACGGERTVRICPTTGLELADSDQCNELLPLDKSCPAGSAMAPGEPDCRKPADLVPGAKPCPDGFETEATGVRCVRYSAPQGGLDSAQDPTFGGELVTSRPTTIGYFGCPDGSATFQVLSSNQVVASGVLTESSVGYYTGVYEVTGAGNLIVGISIECPDGEVQRAAEELVFIDPSGVVTDCAGDLVVGAVVTLLRADTASGPFVAVTNGDATVMDPAVNVANPTTTGADGRYRWDVVAGFYQVVVTAPAASANAAPATSQVTVDTADSTPLTSEVIVVPPARTDVDFVLSDLNCPAGPQPTPTPEPTATATPTPTPEPTATAAPIPATRRAAPDRSSTVESPPLTDTLPAVAPSAVTAVSDVSEPAAITELAFTGTQANQQAAYGLGALALGFTMLGLARRRRFDN